MKCSVVRRPIVQAEGDVLIVGHYQDERRFPPPLAQLDRALGGLLRRVFLEEKFEAKPQQLTFVHTAGRLAAKRVMVVGLGRRGEVNTEAVRRAASAAVKRARDIGGKIVSSELLGVVGVGHVGDGRQLMDAHMHAQVVAHYFDGTLDARLGALDENGVDDLDGA